MAFNLEVVFLEFERQALAQRLCAPHHEARFHPVCHLTVHRQLGRHAIPVVRKRCWTPLRFDPYGLAWRNHHFLAGVKRFLTGVGRGNLPAHIKLRARPAQVGGEHRQVYRLTLFVSGKIGLARMQVTFVCQDLAYGAQGAHPQRRSSGKDVLVVHAKKRPTAAGVGAAHMMNQRAGRAALAANCIICLQQRYPACLVHANHACCGIAFKGSPKLLAAAQNRLSLSGANGSNPLEAKVSVKHSNLIGRNLQLVLRESQCGVNAHLGRTALEAELRSPDCARRVVQAKSNAQLAAAGPHGNQPRNFVPGKGILDSFEFQAGRGNRLSLFVKLFNACIGVAVGRGLHLRSAYPAFKIELVALGSGRQFAEPRRVLVPQPAWHAHFACCLLSCLRQRRALGARVFGFKRGPRFSRRGKCGQQILPALRPHRLVVKLPFAGLQNQRRLKGISACAEQIAAIAQKLLHGLARGQGETFSIGQHQQVKSGAVQPFRIGQLFRRQESNVVGLAQQPGKLRRV